MLKGVELRDYQKQILKELTYMSSIGLFMKTGSGKTITSLARVMENETDNLLVICPQKVITQWQDVIKKHTDIIPIDYKLSMTAKKKNDLFNEYLKDKSIKKHCVVVNFDIIDKITCLDNYINDNWTIIVDESHKINT